jgi:hypothetical protein
MPVIKIRRGTTTQWNASTRVLQVGELGLDTTLNRLKAGNGTATWTNLPFLTVDTAGLSETAQDAVATALAAGTHSNITVTYNDNDNSISLATGPDVITQTSLSNTLTNATTGYVSVADIGVADGVASLDSNGKIPDSEIPSTIARDSEIITSYTGLTDKPDLTVYAPKASPTFTGTVTSSNDLVVDGNFTVNGTTFNASSTSIVIEDNLLQLAHQNPANTVDLGIVVGYNDGSAKHAGLVKDTSENTWKLFKGVTSEPSTTVNFGQGSLDDLAVAGLTASSLTVGNVSNTEIGYLDGVTSEIQTQLNSKAPIASPTFTGSVRIPRLDMGSNGFEIAGTDPFLGGAFSSSIQWSGGSLYTNGNKLALEVDVAPKASPTFTGTVNLAATVATIASGSTVPFTIQNNGTANSFVVNDEASDATPFVISNAGNVGVGTISPIAPMHLAGTSSPMMVFDYYNSDGNSSLFLGRKARGTISSPTAVLSGDSIAAVAARGYGATGFPGSSNGLIGFFAAENFTDTAQGSSITFETVPIGSTTRATRMTIDGSGNTTINSIADATTTTAARGAGYMGIPQSSTAGTSGAYTVVAGDAGEHIYTTTSRTVTIPANASVAFPVGTTLTFISAGLATTTIAINSDTLILSGSGTTGTRTLASTGMATAVKTAATVWFISGNGLS